MTMLHHQCRAQATTASGSRRSAFVTAAVPKTQRPHSSSCFGGHHYVSRSANPSRRSVDQAVKPRASPRFVVMALAEDEMVEVDIKVEGMTCDGCTSRVGEALKKVDKVAKVAVSLENKMACVELSVPTHLEAFAVLPKLIQAITEVGFEAKPHIEGM